VRGRDDSGGKLVVEVLSGEHETTSFDCGVDALNTYLKQQARQDMRRHVATVFVATEGSGGAVVGYYALAAASVMLERLPVALSRKLPRYPSVPAVRLGRLAVGRHHHGKGVGTFLLVDALARSLRSDLAWAAFVVDTKDDGARGFYEAFGFQSFLDLPGPLYIARKTVEPLFGGV
jgi:predicted N-acetyltransferase YhbS